MSAPVVIVDYGLGNLRSVFGAVTRLGFDAVISSDPMDLGRASITKDWGGLRRPYAASFPPTRPCECRTWAGMPCTR
jgi:hypothetical protein